MELFFVAFLKPPIAKPFLGHGPVSLTGPGSCVTLHLQNLGYKAIRQLRLNLPSAMGKNMGKMGKNVGKNMGKNMGNMQKWGVEARTSHSREVVRQQVLCKLVHLALSTKGPEGISFKKI